MTNLDVSTSVDISEIDGTEVEIGKKRPFIRITSHWSRRELVVLKFEDKSFTVEANELYKAIDNATNC